MKIDKKYFDKEYSTMFFKEVEFLKQNNINPTFTKTINGVEVFKYKKTSTLFNILSRFYKKFN